LEKPQLNNPAVIDALNETAALALARLTRGSLHPVSRTLLEALGTRGQMLLEADGAIRVEETPGSGVRGVSGGRAWFLGKADEGATELRCEGEIVARFYFHDALRPATPAVMRWLKRRNLQLHILSGDAPEKVTRLADALGMPADQAFGGLTPEEKAARVKALDRKNTLYLGDGANDSLAFDAAFVTGTPVVDRSLLESKSDFYALGSGLAYLPEAFAAADARANGVRAAFAFALLYNLVVVAIAATGRMSPLLAAILMPLSSIVAIGLVVAAGRRLRVSTREVANTSDSAYSLNPSGPALSSTLP
jgi:Cu2+-exporting ATPase